MVIDNYQPMPIVDGNATREIVVIEYLKLAGLLAMEAGAVLLFIAMIGVYIVVLAAA